MGYRSNLRYDPARRKWRCLKKVNGRQFKASFSRREDATDWLADVERLAAGLAVAGPPITLAQATAAYLDHLRLLRRAPNTIDYYTRKLGNLQAGLGEELALEEITQPRITVYVQARAAAKIGAGTVNKELHALQTLHRHAGVAARWKLPALSHRPKEALVRTPEEVARLWLRVTPATRAAIGLCLLAGLRESEAFAATSEWLRREQQEIVVVLRKTGGTNRTALVATLAGLLPAAGQLVAVKRGPVQHCLERASAAAGLDPPIHGVGVFRHHCGTWAHELGYTREEVALVLGHSRPGATGRYLHSQAVAKKRQILEAVEARFLEALTATRGAALRVVS